MRVKIIKGGKFTHPNPKHRDILVAEDGEEVDVDDVHGDRLIAIGRAEKIASVLHEIRTPEVVEVTPEPEHEEAPEPTRKKRRGRKAGHKRSD